MGRIRAGDRLGAESEEPNSGSEYEDVRRALNLSDPDRPEMLDVYKIRLDGGTQPRESLSNGLIEEYAQEMREGAKFPPVDVFYDGTDYWLADGFHRVRAAKKAGITQVAATIHQGTQRDAQLFSVGVNAQHGLRRSNLDKHRAIQVLLEDQEWGAWSTAEIARRCKVSESLVRSLREKRSEDPDRRVYTTKHGTQATMNVGKIRQARQAPPPGPAWDRDRGPEKAAPNRYVTDDYSQMSFEEPSISYDETFPPVAAASPHESRSEEPEDLAEISGQSALDDHLAEIAARARAYETLAIPLREVIKRLDTVRMGDLTPEQRGELIEMVSEIWATLTAADTVWETIGLMTKLGQVSLAPGRWREASALELTEVSSRKAGVRAFLHDLDSIVLKGLR